MAETLATIGYGLLFQIADSGGVNFTTVAEITNLRGPSMQSEQHEVTHMESPSRYKEFIAGLLDGGEAAFDMNFLPSAATQNLSTGVASLAQSGERRNMKIVWPTIGNPTWSFKGFVRTFEPTSPVNAPQTASCTVKITGPIT